MLGRISTSGLGEVMLRSALSVQEKYAQTATQKASGLVADTYGELGGDASSVISAENAASQLETWTSNTKNTLNRTQAMYSAAGSMVDQLTAFRSKLSAAKSSTSNDTLNQTGKDLLKDLASLMNLRLDGRYMFAGSNTDTAPVDTSKLAVPASPSTADKNYYTGDSEQASVRISDQQSITYGVTADGNGFEQALRAANIVANMNTSPLDATRLDEAYTLATKALDAMIATQSGLSNTSARLETAQKQQTNAKDLLQNMADDIKNVDVAQITLKLSQYDAQLQSAYAALSKVSQLSLTKYL